MYKLKHLKNETDLSFYQDTVMIGGYNDIITHGKLFIFMFYFILTPSLITVIGTYIYHFTRNI